MIKPYNFKEVEEEVLAYWEKSRMHAKLKKRNAKGKKFYFLQGPPYTSGRLHIAHAWNNSLKDIVLRYKRMRGFDVWDRAGYDMHGLPTENSVQKKLGLKDKAEIARFGVGRFVKECHKFSVENAKLMDKDLLRLGVWMDYENAYYPISNDFIEGEWWLIRQAWEQKRLYKGHKIMHWCASCETSLAKHELEYENDRDLSIFLKFRLKGKQDEFLIIWTTTPWTIPYNLGVMVNPELDYIKARVGSEVWYVAKALAGPFISGVASRQFEIIEEFKGAKMEGWAYEHPLSDELRQQFASLNSKNVHTVWLSKEYVDTSAGTGLVHSAPGCGPEDFEVGKRYGVGPFNNLNEEGAFEGMGSYTGLVAKRDDSRFIDELKRKGCLIATAEVEHEYAHCWRCKKPVVFRPTLQWFLKIEDLVQDMLRANKGVSWVPKFGSKAFDAWISALNDNSVTRQRFWGCPAPIWECSCGNVVVIGSSAELKKLAGSVPEDLHLPYVDGCKLKCRCGKMISRIPDVIDVWIDSGTTSWNCLYYPLKEDYFRKYFPADFILEATEQVRLWFSMLLICSMIALKRRCYENVYMHGMILDYQGMKMSKSLGNIISPYEVVDRHGADVLRYYMCSTAAGENINFSWEDVKVRQRNIVVLWNIHKFLIELANEVGRNPESIKPKEIGLEEKFICSRLNSTIRDVTKLLEEYRIDETIPRVEKLFLELSRTYIQLVRDKASAGSQNEKEAVLHAIYSALMAALKMFSVISPFVSEKIFLNLREEFNLREESIHMHLWPEFDKKLIDDKLEWQMSVASDVMQLMLSLREKAQLGIRWPLKDACVIASGKEQADAVRVLAGLIRKQVNVRELRVADSLPGAKCAVKADFAKLGPEFGALAPGIIAQIALESPETVLSHIAKEGKYEVSVNGKKCAVKKEHLIIKRDFPKNFLEAESAVGIVYINTERSEELEAEGFAREVMRRVQALRKEAGLQKSERISLFIMADDEMRLQRYEMQIKEKVGANVIKISESAPAKKHAHSAKEKVRGMAFEVFFDKVPKH